MEYHCEYLSYDSTASFSKVTIDYVSGNEKLLPFYKHPVSIEGLKSSIAERKNFKTPRKLLVEQLRKQYEGIKLTQKQEENIVLLADENTFTFCTAHQPVIFTGPLYVIYKIIHAIKLADSAKKELPQYNFVPVFYMGSEDADLDELGHIYIKGEKLVWDTLQTGAVGRMKVDKPLLNLIERLSGELEVLPYGKELINLYRESYKEGSTIQDATLILINELFNQFGLLVLIPDNAAFKATFSSVVKKELTEEFSHPIVAGTLEKLMQHYKGQASGREINLFYLDEENRVRIEKDGERFVARAVNKSWNEKEILSEVDNYPDRFSYNVILRPLFQEMILPNVVFLGGGGETAYWLELKEVFAAVEIPFPMLLIRNSFLLTNAKQKQAIVKLKLETKDFFQQLNKLTYTFVNRDTKLQIHFDDELQEMEELYERIREIVRKIDPTLNDHAISLKKKALAKLDGLEKKMLRAETKKFEAEVRQMKKLKEQLFPNNSLQERAENFSSFYAVYGKELLQTIYEASKSLEQQFTILDLE